MTANRAPCSQRGQSLAEFGLIIPFFLFVMLGMVDFGRGFYAYVAVTNAARNGADYAAGGPTKAADLNGISAAALADTSGLSETSPTNPTVSAATGNDSLGEEYAEVTVTYSFSPIFPWPGLPDTFEIQRKVRTKVAR